MYRAHTWLRRLWLPACLRGRGRQRLPNYPAVCLSAEATGHHGMLVRRHSMHAIWLCSILVSCVHQGGGRLPPYLLDLRMFAQRPLKVQCCLPCFAVRLLHGMLWHYSDDHTRCTYRIRTCSLQCGYQSMSYDHSFSKGSGEDVCQGST